MKNHVLFHSGSDGVSVWLYIGKLRLKYAQLGLSFSEFARRALYSESVIQGGGGKGTPATHSVLRLLIRLSSGGANVFTIRERTKNIMDISPPIFLALSRGLLRGWISLRLVGVEIGIVGVFEKGRAVCLVSSDMC